MDDCLRYQCLSNRLYNRSEVRGIALCMYKNVGPVVKCVFSYVLLQPIYFRNKLHNRVRIYFYYRITADVNESNLFLY